MEAGRVGEEKQKPFLKRKGQGDLVAPPVGRRRPLCVSEERKMLTPSGPLNESVCAHEEQFLPRLLGVAEFLQFFFGPGVLRIGFEYLAEIGSGLL